MPTRKHPVNPQWETIPTLPNETFFALCREGGRAYAATADRVYISDDEGWTWAATEAIHPNPDDEITDISEQFDH